MDPHPQPQQEQQQQQPLLTGTTVGSGRYLLGEVLGRGGWGAVYAATQQDLKRKVAVKILHRDKSNGGGLDGDGLARFVREARAAAALGHPNIVQVTDFQTNPGEPPFLVMEHLTGQTLGTLLRRERRLPPGRVCSIAHQALAALDVAHRAGIVHRDVKPDNLFLVTMPGVEDFVKLLDFGIAKLLDSTTTATGGSAAAKLTEAGTLLGTPAFMAPEQVIDAFVEAPADIYSLGATMYFALAGRYPLEGSNVSALLYAIAHLTPAPLAQVDPSIDPRLSAIVHRAMAKDPNARWSSAAEMRAAIEPFVTARPSGLGGSMSGPPPPPPPGMLPPPDAIADTIALGSPNDPTQTYATPHHLISNPPPQLRPTPPPTSQPKSNATLFLLLGIIGFLLLLIVVGGGGYLYYLSQQQPATPTTALPTTAPTPTPTPTLTTAPTAQPTPPTTKVSPPTPTTPPKVITDAGGGPSPVPPPPPSKVAMTGRNPRITGSGGFEDIGLAAGKAEATRVLPMVASCHVQTEFDPPMHESGSFVIEIDPSGAIRDVRTFGKGVHPKYEACVFAVLRQTRWPATASGAKSAKVFFTARVGD
jgi:serine/threonine protein kinase